MSSTTETKAPPSPTRKVVALTKNSYARVAFVIVDWGMFPGEIAVSYWRMRGPEDRADENLPSQAAFDSAKREGLIAPRAKLDAWRRYAVRRDNLEDAVCVAFRDNGPHEWQTVLDYLCTTGWGRELP